MIQGDILLPPNTRHAVGRHSRQRRSSQYYGVWLWPVVNGTREVPYVIEDGNLFEIIIAHSS